MGNDNKISIVVPVYNAEKCLKKCIDSIILQTYKNIEIILIDDGSTDNSLNICKQYETKDKRIIVIHKENGGPSETRNLGIEKATGKFITFVDADDYIDTKMYEKLESDIKKYNSDIAVCKIKKVRKWEEKKHKLETKYDTIKMGKEEALNDILEIKSNITDYLYNKLYKTELFKDIRLPNGKIFEDMDIMYKIIDKTSTITYTNYEGYYYVQHTASITRNMKQNDIIEGINIIKNRYKILEQNNKIDLDKLKQNRADFILKMYVAIARHNYIKLTENTKMKEEYEFYKRFSKNREKYNKLIYNYNFVYKIFAVLLKKNLKLFLYIVKFIYNIKEKIEK